MNDFLLIFMGIFILLLIFLIFILLAYVYHTYTTYTVDINKNLETSEDAINNTSAAFNKLQDTVVNELAKVNKNQETIVKIIPDNLVALNTNLLDIFEISSNNNKLTDITKTKIEHDSLSVVKPFTSYKNFSILTDKDTNYLTVCNKQTDPSKRTCIKMNIDDSDMFNIYTKNINNSNVSGINIYDSNNSVLASFDAFNRKISLGSGSAETAAISIDNNVYTPNVIVCKYSYTASASGATSGEINTAITSVTGVHTSITLMLTALSSAIDNMSAGSAKTSAQAFYSTANTKNSLVVDANINIQTALSALNYLNESYIAATNAAATATTATTGIITINSTLSTIKSNIDTARINIDTASIVPSVPKITLNIISNNPINTSTFINLPIFDTFTIINDTQTQATNISYLQNILKFKPAVAIVKNSLVNITINLNTLSGLPNPSTTTGYITAT